MRIAIISPYSIGPIRGNITTVKRISRFLARAGVELVVLPADVLSPAEMEQRLTSFAPQLIHAFHASYCGGIARLLAERFNLPFMITITGSDLHDPLFRNQPDTVRAITAAQATACFDGNEAAELAGYFPQVADRVVVVPQGVEALPVTAADSFGLPDDAFMLLLPAAIRPVKQIEFPLQALEQLTDRIPALRLVIAGGIIDQDYAANIRGMLCNARYAQWLGEIPLKRMGALYTRADVVLNCSRFESMPNTILEAMAMGRPVLAADIQGNRTLIRHNDTGLLYQDTASFTGAVVRLTEDDGLRAELGQRAEEFVHRYFSPRHEAAEYMHIYNSLINGAK